MDTISQNELKKLPYISELPSDGRSVMILTFWDDVAQDWILYLPVRPDELGRLAGGEPVVGSYVGRVAQQPGADLELPYATFVFQHLSFPSVVPHAQKVTTDVEQFAAILQDFRLIEQHAQEVGNMASLLAASALEHLIVVVRATYDLLQKFIRSAAAIVHQVNDRQRKVIQELPDSFAQVVLHGKTPRCADEIAQKFELPTPLAKFYANDAEFFRWLRDLRVGIEHHGNQLPSIFQLEDGFGVRVADRPWSQLDVWKEQELKNDRFGSLRIVYGHLIQHTIDTLNLFPTAYQSCVTVPPELSPGIKLFLRNPYGRHLVGLPSLMRNPWQHSEKA